MKEKHSEELAEISTRIVMNSHSIIDALGKIEVVKHTLLQLMDADVSKADYKRASKKLMVRKKVKKKK